MRRDLNIVVALLSVSAAMAVAANIGWHKLDWIRLAPPPRPSVTATPGEEAAAPVSAAKFLTVDQVLKHLLDGTACFVDAREEAEYQEGHLRGAINLPSSAAYRRVDEVSATLPTEGKVIVYCGGRDCEAAETVADVLKDYQYADVEVYKNGWGEVVQSCKFDDCIVTEERR